jgi:hypothetical protein
VRRPASRRPRRRKSLAAKESVCPRAPRADAGWSQTSPDAIRLAERSDGGANRVA